jgi:azurin
MSAMSRLAAGVAMLFTLSPVTTDAAKPAAAVAPRTVVLQGTDDMKFSPTVIEAKRGERLRVSLRTVGALPKLAMAHNFVLLKKGADVQALVTASAMARATDFFAPAQRANVLSVSKLAGAGETVEADVTAPTAPGRYVFICTFPGHYQGGMKGVLIVK